MRKLSSFTCCMPKLNNIAIHARAPDENIIDQLYYVHALRATRRRNSKWFPTSSSAYDENFDIGNLNSNL